MARLKMEPGTITTTSNLSNNVGSVINPSPGTAVVTTTGGMAGVTSLSLASMDCYEDMFKEITKKLYGEEGLAEVIGDTHQNIVYETDGFRTDGTTTIATGPTGLTLIQTGANGLAPGTILIQRRIQDEKGRVWTVEGLPQGEQISLATVAAPPPPPVVTTTTAAPAVPIEERWFESEEILDWTTSKIARYNPSQKVFRCVDCDFVGFLSRVAEHWLGNHASLRVFQCPRCPYTSAWARCVRMHLTRQHGETLTDNSLWKENPVLEEVTKFLNGLKTKVEQKGDTSVPGEKRYTCPYCTYATDRRDLFNRHENIHRDEKPFQCYVCDKQFNRADHVKKHFMRMHRDHPYDINKIRKNLPKSHGGAVPFFNNKFHSKQQQQSQPMQQTTENELTQEIDASTLTNQPITLQLQGGANQTVTLQQIPHIAYFNPPATPGQTGPLQGIPGVGGNKKEAKAKGAKKKKSGEKMYSCSYCPWQGVDNWCLKRHLNTHIKPFLCALCDYKAARSERLATHVLKVHNKRVCHKCSFLADDTESLSQHIQDSHQNPLVKTGFHCNVCQEYFELRADLEAHAILEHQKVIVQCDLCDFRTTDELSMESHLRDKHNLQPGMGAVAAAAAAAAAAAGQPQMQLSQTPTMQMTETIPVEQQQPEETQVVVQDHHLTGAIATEDHAYHDTSTIIQPKQEPGVEIEEVPMEQESDPATLCEQCGIEFLDEPSLRLHEKRHEVIPKPVVDTKSTRVITRNYTCSTCSYTCTTKKMMLQHQRAHTGFELECRADGCQFTTPFENSLKEHIHVDHNEDAVRCPHCGLKMASLNCFTIHWRFHHATLCSLCVNVYKVKYCVKENDIHDIILKSPLQLLNGEGDISGGSNKGGQDGIPISERETQRIEDNLHITNNNEFVSRLGGEPPMKKARLELVPNLNPISNMYKREALKVLPKLVELAVTPVTFTQNRENIRKQRKIRLSRMRRKDGHVVVSQRRRYTPRGSVNNVIFRSVRDRDGFKCHSIMCEKPYAYRNKGQLVLHNIWYHTRRIFKCDNCEMRYPHLYQALLHKMREHPPHLQQHAQLQLHQHQLQLQLQQHHVHHQNELAVHTHQIIGSFKTE